MLSGVCHLLNGCLGETLIKAVFCRIVTFHLRFFSPGKIGVYFSVLSVCIVSHLGVQSVCLKPQRPFSAVQLQGLALYRNVCTVVVMQAET